MLRKVYITPTHFEEINDIISDTGVTLVLVKESDELEKDYGGLIGIKWY
jgi:hypothetical protein